MASRSTTTAVAPTCAPLPEDYAGPDLVKLSTKECAAYIRTALKVTFPGVKFSVRSEAYTDIRVSWTDGPTVKQVDALVIGWKSKSFDGMTDSTTYNTRKLVTDATGRAFGADLAGQWVTTSREYSDALRAECARRATALLGEPFKTDGYYTKNINVGDKCWPRYDGGYGSDLVWFLAEHPEPAADAPHPSGCNCRPCYERVSAEVRAESAESAQEAPADDVEHKTRTVMAADRGERYVTKSNGSAGRWVRNGDAWALCSCGWKAAGADRAEARMRARAHRAENAPQDAAPAAVDRAALTAYILADVTAVRAARVAPADAVAQDDGPTDVERAHQAGREAYAADRPRVPAADATVTALVDGMPVGSGASDVFASFLRGFDAAADEAAAAVLAEAPADAPADVAEDVTGEDEAPAVDDVDQDDAPVWDIDEGDDDAALIVEHTHADGSRVLGSSRGDGVWEIARAYGQLRAYDGAICLRNTRDRLARRWKLQALAGALRAAGHTVRMRIDDRARDAATRDAERAERAGNRVVKLEDRAARRAAESDARHNASRRITGGIPMGQPVQAPGHHSRNAHLRALDRADNHTRKSIELRDEARQIAERAAGSAALEALRNNPRAMIRRAERLETENRRIRAQYADGTPPAGSGSARAVEMNEADISFLRGRLDEMQRSGEFRGWSRDDFTPGDMVNVYGEWRRVVRANAKSVSVPWWGGDQGQPEHFDRVPYDKVYGRRRDGWQINSPGGTPWPVELAVKVDRWYSVTERVRRGNYEDHEVRARVGAAQRIAHGLPLDAATAEVEAFTRGITTGSDAQRELFGMYVDLMDRMKAGEKPADLAATVAPWAGSLPAWRMPAGQPVDRRTDQLRAGDVVFGMYDRGRSSHILRHVCGVVASVTFVPKLGTELDDMIRVEMEGGDVREFKAQTTWFACYPGGRPTMRVADVQEGQRIEVRGVDQFGKPTRAVGYAGGVGEFDEKRNGRPIGKVLGVSMSENPGGWNGWRFQVFTPLDAWCALAPADDETAEGDA